MQLVHEPPTGSQSIVASSVRTADSFLAKAFGLMFRRSLPAEYGLAFRFDDRRTRTIHMVFVFVPLDVIWVADGVVTHVERLHPWRGIARAEADLIVELPAGGADGVAVGDQLSLSEA
ncbi:hypothetical protein Halru_1885 [Halovivax ruber XH-70]|uniref:DUF192 domain-containing protein n=1 Tax=Halovivax ruber (strain DSM 18193 / JCM 13892 / XH-70) TaxID=797302 RepID=L0ICK2_HALRX|nr:DUF192 domain-containing protein [Halovivax ruber]AGB16484.1 hypothetical protein Halru_1885 [Halovivax ruber XH-70]